MPVILKREDEDRWLSGEALSGNDREKILAPYPAGEMEAYPVSSRVNSPDVDDERLILPLKTL
jgi:putative SOS response-associated peptidase YedK